VDGRAKERDFQAEAKARMKAGKEPSGNFPQGIVKGRAIDKVAKLPCTFGKTYENATVAVKAAKADPEKFDHLVRGFVLPQNPQLTN
jgi:hypothetical protein